MSLDGVNSKCARCKQDCKQFKQVKVVQCLRYLPIKSFDRSLKSKTM
jgi:hypothetical protein